MHFFDSRHRGVRIYSFDSWFYLWWDTLLRNFTSWQIFTLQWVMGFGSHMCSYSVFLLESQTKIFQIRTSSRYWDEPHIFFFDWTTCISWSRYRVVVCVDSFPYLVAILLFLFGCYFLRELMYDILVIYGRSRFGRQVFLRRRLTNSLDSWSFLLLPPLPVYGISTFMFVLSYVWIDQASIVDWVFLSDMACQNDMDEFWICVGGLFPQPW